MLRLAHVALVALALLFESHGEQCQDTLIALVTSARIPRLQALIGAKKPRYLDCPLHYNVLAKTITMVLLMLVVVVTVAVVLLMVVVVMVVVMVIAQTMMEMMVVVVVVVMVVVVMVVVVVVVSTK